MKFALGYFYQVRFFTPNMIPVSTALGDPKWYHQNKGQQFTFLDKNKNSLLDRSVAVYVMEAEIKDALLYLVSFLKYIECNLKQHLIFLLF